MSSDEVQPIRVDKTFATSPWADIDATTAPVMEIRKPINIKRSMFPAARHLDAGDTLEVTLTTMDDIGGTNIDRAPPFEINRAICVDSITKFEVVDEFGVDVGIGFVLGQAKR